MHLLFAATLLTAHPADSTLAGTWKVIGDVGGYPVNQTCTITQEKTALTGSCVSEQATEAITGEVTAGSFSFKQGADYEGSRLIVTFTGTFEGAARLRGSIDVQPMNAAGTFTADRVEAK